MPAGSQNGTPTPIDALNPGVKLPHQTIVPIRRADASGDTFVFTQFLDFSTQRWEDDVGYGTNVEWPGVAGERTATGNDGMVKAMAATPYSIGYIGISFRDAIDQGRARHRAGEEPERQIRAADTRKRSAPRASDARLRARRRIERLSLVFARGDNSYPLVNYEYAVVSTAPAETRNRRRRCAIFCCGRSSLEGGNAPKYLDAVGFIPLPDFIRALSEKQINLIK